MEPNQHMRISFGPRRHHPDIRRHCCRRRQNYMLDCVSCTEYEMIQKYLVNTHGDTHDFHLDLVKVHKVCYRGHCNRFNNFQSYSNRTLLWHGTNINNIHGILSEGLKVSHAGMGMFGKAIYFADMSSKAAQYCKINPCVNNAGSMLLCEVALGNMQELTCSEHLDSPLPGFDSVKGLGKTTPNPNESFRIECCNIVVPYGTPVENSIDTALLYNEYAIYDENRIRIKYLVDIKLR